MIKLKRLSLVLIITAFSSCSDNDDSLTQQDEAQKLEEMFAEIKALSTSEPCIDASQWTFTSYGSKACGGPIGYIAYSLKIDTALFLKKIEEHRKAQQEFNNKWGLNSDCSVPTKPEGVTCENGKPQFIF